MRRQYEPDVKMLIESGIGFEGEDSAKQKYRLQKKLADNGTLKIIDTKVLERNILALLNQLEPMTKVDPLNSSLEDKMLFNRLRATMETLLQIDDRFLISLVPYLEDAFKAGVSSTYIDGYHAQMYQYL